MGAILSGPGFMGAVNARTSKTTTLEKVIHPPGILTLWCESRHVVHLTFNHDPAIILPLVGLYRRRCNQLFRVRHIFLQVALGSRYVAEFLPKLKARERLNELL